jgi:alkylated DNA repair dioxygenase AlkB
MPSSKLQQPQLVGSHDDRIDPSPKLPSGFRYQPDLISTEEEANLVDYLQSLPFAPFDFHGHLANRRVISFGFRYDYDNRRLVEAADIPDFLLGLREKVASFAGRPAEAFAQVLINEYRPGAGIGWHRDKPHFELVFGLSLASACRFRFRRKHGSGWQRYTLEAEPRSLYLMTGEARHVWEHSIPAVEQPRYSITFRTMAEQPSRRSG